MLAVTIAALAAVTFALVLAIEALAQVSYAPTLAFNVAMFTLAAVMFARSSDISVSCTAAFDCKLPIAKLAAVTLALMLAIEALAHVSYAPRLAFNVAMLP